MYSMILHGRRLQKLRFSVQNVSAFSISFSSDVNSQDGLKGKTFTASYLVDSLGFTTKLAESISRKVSFENNGNPDSVLNLLRNHGFTDSQISNIVRDYPQVLIADAERSIGPKLEFLQSREGVSSSELTEILSKVPKIFGIKKEKALSVYYDFVKEVIEADKSSKFEKLCHSSLPQEGSKQGNKMRNVMVLRELGVPQERLFSLLTSDRNFVCGKERFEESLKKVVEMGFDPTTTMFVQALRVLYQMNEKTVEERVQVYKKLGFVVIDVWELFKRSPSCFGYSAESVKKKGEFLVKKMNWPLKALVSHPQVFNYSMEKRIVPRCNVIKALMSKGLLGSEIPKMSSVLVCTDDAFLKRYVKKHNDMELAAELMAIFTEKLKKQIKLVN